MNRKVYIALRDFMKQLSRENVNAYAASTAFFLFVSLIPMLILVCSIIPYTPLTEADLMKAAVEVTPAYVNGVLTSVITEVYGRSAGVISIAAVATIWASGKGVLALMRGLNAVNDVQEDRNYVLLRIQASFYTVMMVVAMLLSLLAMVFGNVFIELILKRLPEIQYLFGFLIHFRFLWVWLVLTVFFVLLYTFIPNKKMKLRGQIPGAVFSAVSWSVFSWCFSIYVDRFHGFSMYGSLTTIVVIMLWLYTCMYIILVGASLNRYWKVLMQFFGRL